MAAPTPNEVSGSEHSRWFVEEVKPHESSLRSYLRGSFPKVQDVDDVIQESYLRIWQRKHEQPIKSAKAFLFTVARRLALNLVRRDRRSPIAESASAGDLNVADGSPAAAEIMSESEKIELLIEAVDSLPARCREVVILRKFQLIPQKEVARLLNISEKGVEMQLSRGLTRCRVFFRTQGIHDFFQL